MQGPFDMQVSANGSHIDSLVDAMVDLSDLTLDVMTYRVIKRLTTLKNRWDVYTVSFIALYEQSKEPKANSPWLGYCIC